MDTPIKRQASNQPGSNDTPLHKKPREDDMASGESLVSHQTQASDVLGTLNHEQESTSAQFFNIPTVWSSTRQALCDTMESFKAYQGGIYSRDRIARGLLLTKLVEARDCISRTTIITYVGGQRKKNGEGVLERSGDLDVSKMKDYCEEAMNFHMPILVIAARDYPHIEFAHGGEYFVLDWFFISHIWVDFQKGTGGDMVRFWRMRLEKIDFSGPSWWCPAGDHAESDSDQEDDHPTDAGDIVFEGSCHRCEKESPQVYAQGWACLSPHCESFMAFEDASIDIFTDLSLNSEFIDYQACFHEPLGGQAALRSINPNLPFLATGHYGTEKEYRKGIVCPRCRACIRRREWTGWVYETLGCGFTHSLPMFEYPLSRVKEEENRAILDKNPPRFEFGADHAYTGQIKFTICHAQGRYVAHYLLPDATNTTFIGSVSVYRADSIRNAQQYGPDELWAEFQRDMVKLSRNPARLATKPGEILTKHFQQNWGAPYKFGVPVLSSAFSDAPDCILKALQRLRFAGRHAVETTTRIALHSSVAHIIPDTFVDFNELLSLGYMEDDVINYHDDGEDTLGPTVATLSLGSPSKMSFRLKSKFNDCKPASACLNFVLLHGDMVVMHGEKIHTFYEHRVVPEGKRRFALTCRYIDPAKLATDEDRKDAATKSKLPERAHNFVYHGN